MPQPISRARSTAASSPAGSVTRARSLTSTKTRSIASARATSVTRSAGHSAPGDSGSVLTKTDSDGGRSASRTARRAVARQTQSSSAVRPRAAAAANNAAGLSRSLPAGPRASASRPTTCIDRRSTTGWNTAETERRSMTASMAAGPDEPSAVPPDGGLPGAPPIDVALVVTCHLLRGPPRGVSAGTGTATGTRWIGRTARELTARAR